MENAILWFVMVVILSVDADSCFKSVFKDICADLLIIYWTFARGNHKGMIIEKYHCFLNKNLTIARQDRGMHDVFLQNKKAPSMPGLVPQLMAQIFSELLLMSVDNSVTC